MVQIITLLKNKDKIVHQKKSIKETQFLNELNMLDNKVKNTTQKMLVDYSSSLFVIRNRDYKLILN